MRKENDTQARPLAGRAGQPENAAETMTTGLRKNFDLEDLREGLEQKRGPELWRSLEELAGSPEFEELIHREFPQAASEWNGGNGSNEGVDRRRFLQLMSASLAFGGLTSCTRQPLEKIVPFVDQPEQTVPGKPLYFATSRVMDGFADGLLVESHMGRPTKVEGNPEHPSSQGATDLFAQASILDLYDPDRLQTVLEAGRIRTWRAFGEQLEEALALLEGLRGTRLRILTGTVTSPSLAAGIQTVLERFPKGRWHQYEAAGCNNSRVAAKRAFGRPAGLTYDFTRAEVVVALDADFLTQGAGAVRYARDFMRGRKLHQENAENHQAKMNRLYCLEPSPTSTGTVADHRVPASNTEIASFALALAAQLGVTGAPKPTADGKFAELVRVVAADLSQNRGQSLVVAGEQQPIELHILCHAINSALGNLGSTVIAIEPAEAEPTDTVESIRQLCQDMAAGEVDVLLILGSNPVYDAPADLDFVNAMQMVPRRICSSVALNETTEYCQWVLPETHYLESWGDARAFDGTVSLTQPLIEPLYDGKTKLEVLSYFFKDGEAPGDQLVRGFWESRLRATEAQFNKYWRKALHDGLLTDTQLPPVTVAIDTPALLGAIDSLTAKSPNKADQIELTLRPDPTVWDGQFANNGWLQECPKPISRLTWDNPLLVGPALATEFGLSNEQLVEITAGEQRLEVPVWIHPGQARRSVTLHLGYGRTVSGRVGTGRGFDANKLRTADSPWTRENIELRPLADSYKLATTQLHHNIDLEGTQEVNLEGKAAERRHLVRTGTLAEYNKHPDFAQHVAHGPDPNLSLYPSWEYTGHAWGLSVDLNSCTGCNACVIACQSENNIPIVGKEQVALGREMHWIRIDRYFQGDIDSATAHNQPVMCMHCEQAPCEVVCPVAATVHSDEGLNDMVYNRCVGTRYCSNNCPYKVRRFNFLKWNDTETPVLKLLRNPDVTVRSRGVMEKCTYCVQRINKARITSRREDRQLRDGEIQTACQQACPTEAIVFGDINDPESEVHAHKGLPTSYGLLTELGTRPRTTYLAKVKNPNPALGEEA